MVCVSNVILVYGLIAALARATSALPAWPTDALLSGLSDRQLAPQLDSAEVGTFAHHTFSKRIPQVLNMVAMTFGGSAQLELLKAELSADSEASCSGERMLLTRTGNDTQNWAPYLSQWCGRPWSTHSPPISMELFFYRRLLHSLIQDNVLSVAETDASVGSSSDVCGGASFLFEDPFAKQKAEALHGSVAAIDRLVLAWNRARHSGPGASGTSAAAKLDEESREEIRLWFRVLLHSTLWGNTGDLALHPGKALDYSGFRFGVSEQTQDPQGRPARPASDVLQESAMEQLLPFLLDDATSDVFQVLMWLASSQHQTVRVDIILDNAGIELVSDLALATFLLEQRLAARVILHVKAHPLFISDATAKDIDDTLQFLLQDDEQTRLVRDDDAKEVGRQLALAVKELIRTGRLEVRSDPFWTAPRVFYDMSQSLASYLSDSSLLIVKGDANYRRLLGDHKWGSVPFCSAVEYMPAPTLAVRVAKAEVYTGIRPQVVEDKRNTDPDWLTGGRFGMIQFCPRANGRAVLDEFLHSRKTHQDL